MEILLCLLLIIKSGFILAASSVSLTVEGGGSLVGEHCPGNISLLCEGVELNSLRWRYNGNVTLQTFLSDNEPSTTTQLNNPAFLSVQLTAISALSDSIASFYSILLVDAELLHRNAISNISCGDVSNFESLPIYLIIIYETPLSNPEISFISAYYDSGVLQNVQVSWMKLQPACPGHVLDSTSYTVDLEGFQPIQTDYNNCGVELCEVNVGDMLSIDLNRGHAHQLTISVINTTHPIINSSLSPYKTVRRLSNTSDDYLLIKHNFDHNCRKRGVCTSPLNASTVTFCSITYQKYIQRVLRELNVSIGEQFTLNDLVPDYYEAVIRIHHSDINEIRLKSNFIVGPNSPEIVKVILFFSGRGELSNIQVDWANNVTCNHDLIQYEIRVKERTQVVSTKSINSDECTPTVCTLTTLVTSRHLTESLNLFLVAVNSGGTNMREYSTPVYQSSTLYYRPKFQLLHCTALQINCFGTTNDTSCICEYYGSDFLYKQLQSKQELHYNDVLKLHQGIPLHYFVLKWSVSETLELREEFFYKIINCTQEIEGSGPATSTILIIAVSSGASLVCLFCIIMLSVAAVFVVKHKKKRQKQQQSVSSADNSAPTENTQQSRSLTPEYEEIPMFQFDNIKVSTNAAYKHLYREAKPEPVYQNTLHSYVYTGTPRKEQTADR